MKREIFVCDHQSTVPVPPTWLVALEEAGVKAARTIESEHLLAADSPLVTLQEVDVALVDDSESDRVHRDFMGIDGPTDVITFEHGEIVIGVEVAKRQAADYGEPELRELLRYVIHGLLHLGGHEDENPTDREKMEAAQEALVSALWPEVEKRGA